MSPVRTFTTTHKNSQVQHAPVLSTIHFSKAYPSTWNLAYRTFSNFVSSSRKLKFRPIMIKCPSKPTFSWQVFQAVSIAFRKSLSFSAYPVSNLSGNCCMHLSPRLSMGKFIQHHSSSPLVPTPSRGLGKWAWARRCSLRGQLGPMGLGESACHCTRSGLSPAHLRNGTWAPKYFLKATSSTFGLSHPEQEKLCSAGEWREEDQLLPCCSTQEKKIPRETSAYRKHQQQALQRRTEMRHSLAHNLAGGHFSLCLPYSQPPARYCDGNSHITSRLPSLTCSALPGGHCSAEQLKLLKKSLKGTSFISSKQNKTSPARDHTETPQSFHWGSPPLVLVALAAVQWSISSVCLLF